MPEDVIAQTRHFLRDAEAEVETQRVTIASLPQSRRARSEAEAVLAILVDSLEGYQTKLHHLLAK